MAALGEVGPEATRTPATEWHLVLRVDQLPKELGHPLSRCGEPLLKLIKNEPMTSFSRLNQWHLSLTVGFLELRTSRLRIDAFHQLSCRFE